MNDYKYIIDSRGTGKTRKLLEFAKMKNATVVCRHPGAMRAKAEAYGIVGLQFVSYGNVLEDIRLNNDASLETFVVDEIKSLMDYLLASNCVGFTQTEDN